MVGIVTKSMGLWYQVTDAGGMIYNCRLKGKFKLADNKISNPVVVGDRIKLIEDDGNAEAKIITEIFPRENYIIRKSPKKKGHGHIIAANLDQVMLIVTLAEPCTSSGFIDRFLVTTETYRIPAIIVFNKTDLLDTALLKELETICNDYQSIGYQTFAISALNKSDIKQLLDVLSHKTSLLSGHSGVGKSTIINQIIPKANQQTSEISSFSNKGVHTTTFAERFSINQYTHLIDTPGIKELGLAEIKEDELSHYFPELRDLFGKCKFHNCSHTHEPECAIEKAHNEGKITLSRYNSYISMLQADDNRR